MPEIDVRRTLPLHVLWIVGLSLLFLTLDEFSATRLGQDSHAYWAAWRGEMYDTAPGRLDAYNYSPAFAQAIWPIAQLPWPLFGAFFSAFSALALAHLFRPLGWRWVGPLLLCCSPEILSGNVFWLMALVAVYGMRWPALWAIPLLTKITPALGPLWFGLRGEWQKLLVSAIGTLAAVGVSLLISPDLWREWAQFLVAHSAGVSEPLGSQVFPSLTVRLPVGLLVLVICARTDRIWGLPVAMVLVTPVSGLAAFTMLAAIPRLSRLNDHSG